jgi:hypothetical protein
LRSVDHRTDRCNCPSDNSYRERLSGGRDTDGCIGHGNRVASPADQCNGSSNQATLMSI